MTGRGHIAIGHVTGGLDTAALRAHVLAHVRTDALQRPQGAGSTGMPARSAT